MGVSRATLREAIAALRTANLVRTTRGRGGGTVVDLSPATPGAGGGAGSLAAPLDELMDSLVFRRIVEPGACYLAATRALTEDQRQLLTQAHIEVREADSPANHRQADSRLHLAIASLTGSAAAGGRGHRRPGRPARNAHRHPVARSQHRALQPPARRDRGCDPAWQRPPARRVMESTATTQRHCCGGSWDERRIDCHDGVAPTIAPERERPAPPNQRG